MQEQDGFAENIRAETAVLAPAAHETYSATLESENNSENESEILSAIENNSVLENESENESDCFDDLNDDAPNWIREQRAGHKALPWQKRPSVAMVGAMIFLMAFGLSSAEATRQSVQLKLACNSLSDADTGGACNVTQAQVLVSGLQQALAVARGLATMVASGLVGPLSDRYGRKPFLGLVILCAICGGLWRYILFSGHVTLPVVPLVLAELVANCSGGGVAVLALANCYVADIAPAHKRTRLLGVNFACLFVGMSTGPLAGNAILRWAQRRRPGISGEAGLDLDHVATWSRDLAPLRLELAVSALVLLFVVLVLPESRGAAARRMSQTLSRAPSMASVRPPCQDSRFSKTRTFLSSSLVFLRPTRLLLYPADSVPSSRRRGIKKTRLAVVLLVLIDCMISGMASAVGEAHLLYGIYKFRWDTTDIGHFMAATCSTRAVVLLLVSPVLTHNILQNKMQLRPNKRRFDRIDYGMVVIGFSFECIGQILASSARNSGVFLASLMLSAVACLAMPAVNSSITKFYPESKIGELYGGLSIVKNVSTVVFPVAVLALYKTALAKWDFPQVIFLVLAALFVIFILMVTAVVLLLDSVDSSAEASDAEGLGEVVR